MAKRREIFLPELAKNRRRIQNETFDDCDLKGPAVVALIGHVDLTDCAFAEAIEDVLWEFGNYPLDGSTAL